jgi:hypothetical protein
MISYPRTHKRGSSVWWRSATAKLIGDFGSATEVIRIVDRFVF